MTRYEYISPFILLNRLKPNKKILVLKSPKRIGCPLSYSRERVKGRLTSNALIFYLFIFPSKIKIVVVSTLMCLLDDLSLLHLNILFINFNSFIGIVFFIFKIGLLNIYLHTGCGGMRKRNPRKLASHSQLT